MHLYSTLIRTIFLSTCVFCIAQNSLFGQLSLQKKIDLDKFLQEFFPQQNENLNYEDLYESLYQLYLNPIELSSVKRENLQNLHILTENQINQYFNYIQHTGPLISLFELQAIPDFDLETIEKLLPFVKLDLRNSTSTKGFIRELSDNQNFLQLRMSRVLEEKKGFENHKYTGSPDKLYLRIKSGTPKKNSFGITMEKDAGERIMWDPAKQIYGPDFFSFHFALYNRKNLKTLVIGDYQLQFGQSLLLGAGFRFGKGSEPVNMVKRNNLGIKPYSSVMESGYFRGLAFTYSLSKMTEFTFFYSGKKEDSHVNVADSTDAEFANILTFGYHRTSAEIENEKSINEKVVGSNISFLLLKKKMHVGLSGVGTRYNMYYHKAEHAYNLFEFEGKQNIVLGADFSLLFKNFNFFGEAGISQNKGEGMVAGFVSSLSRSLELSLVVRNYEKNFHTFYGKAFGENPRNINESGIYWGIKISPFPKWSMAAFYDRFSFPWLKYRVDAPSHGDETLFRLSFLPAKKIHLYFQCKMLQKESNDTNDDNAMHILKASNKMNYQLNIDFTISPAVAFKSRVQLSTVKSGHISNQGYAMFQELNLEYWRISLDMRYSVFETDDYDNRQFTFERDVRNAFSIPQLYGSGMRAYFVLKYKCNKNLELSCKYSTTHYDKVDQIGSGLEQINGNKVNEIKIQAFYVF